MTLSPRIQRLLLIFLMVYYVLFGGSVYTENNPPLRVAHQVFTALLFGLWLLDLWRRGRVFPATRLDMPLLVYAAAWLVIALLARDPRVSVEHLWPLLVRILGFYLLVDIMRRGRQRWVMEALFLVGGAVVVLSAIELAAWYFGLPFVPGFVQGWPQVFGLTLPPAIHRLSLALTVSTWVGNFTAVLIPLAAVWAMTARERDHRIMLWLVAAGLLAVLVLSESRGALAGLGLAAGVLVLFWLLRADVRARFPAALRPLLDWRVLLVGAALAGALALAVTFWLSVNAARPGDVNRLDLWRSAIAMAVDHPVVGVGIYQYPAALRWYGLPTLSRSQDHLLTAHNLPLHTLAEGGAVGFAVSLGLVAVFGWLWWKAWRGAPHAGHRRRLEGVLAALVVFAVHNIYDTFPLTTMYVTVIVCAAYVVAGHVTRAQAVAGPATPGRRWPVYALLVLLVGVQVAFLPVHAGTLAHGRAQAALRAGQPLEDALEAARAAHAADPWLDLYPMHEAYILGLRAADNPGDLPAAIAAHERSLDLNPSWDEGWHNLGGLYAQAGRYADAAAAAETAIAWNPVKPGYHLRLGVYREALGDAAAARAAYLEALRWNPELASSGFWTDPAHPERAGVLAGAPAHFAGRPEIALRVALAAGDLDAATGIAQAIDPEDASQALLRALAQWAAQVDDAQVAPCPACYYERVRQSNSEQYGRDYTFLAELALQGDGVAHPLDMTAEEAARAALFLSEGRAARAWYVLAQLAARDGAEADAVNAMLARAAPALSTPLNFGIAVYGRPAAFEELPQARTPALARADYEPWLVLLDRLEAAGAWDDARRVGEALLRADPYLWEVRERLAALPGWEGRK